MGIDLREGPGVDEVADGATFGKAKAYDIVVCCEALEHYEHPEKVIENAARVLKPGGYLIVTTASERRAPHGNDGNAVQPGEFYDGISAEELGKMIKRHFESGEASEDVRAGDSYAWGRTK